LDLPAAAIIDLAVAIDLLAAAAAAYPVAAEVKHSNQQQGY
jgi:hypothetical protein